MKINSGSMSGVIAHSNGNSYQTLGICRDSPAATTRDFFHSFHTLIWFLTLHYKNTRFSPYVQKAVQGAFLLITTSAEFQTKSLFHSVLVINGCIERRHQSKAWDSISLQYLTQLPAICRTRLFNLFTYRIIPYFKSHLCHSFPHIFIALLFFFLPFFFLMLERARTFTYPWAHQYFI